MNALLDELDLAADVEQDEQQLAMAGAIPDGKYHARLVEAAEDQAGEYDVVRLKFQILSRPYAGKIVEETLFLTGSDADKTDKARQRKRMFCHRLGLLTKSPNPADPKRHIYALVPGKQHLRDCLGAECIIDVKVQEREFEGKKGNMVKYKDNKLQWEGVFELNDPKVKDVPRGKSDAPLPAPTRQADPDLSGI